MMIKITEKCSMGCSHCMNNATIHGNHMTFGMFKAAIDFQKCYGTGVLVISGGEPTEHPDFKRFIEYAADELPKTLISVTTNGLWLENEYEWLLDLYKNHPFVMFQVSSFTEYYPKSINPDSPIYNHPTVMLCSENNTTMRIYPQGRALTNKLDWEANASKCFNLRAVVHQVGYANLKNVFGILASKNHWCTPHIDIYGGIKLGESDLCPTCSSIYKTETDIFLDILDFQCSKCNHVNCKLSTEYRKLIGEE